MVDVASLKVAELKDELSKRGLDTKGLKKDLAERLEAAQNDDNPADSTSVEALKEDDIGVGNEMLDKIEDKTDLEAENEKTQPAALDDEVARIVAEEEEKETRDSVEPAKSVSPMPVEPSTDTNEITKPEVVSEEEEAKEKVAKQEEPLTTSTTDNPQIDVERDNILTPPLPINGLPEVEEDKKMDEDGKRKRDDEPSVPAPSKRPRKVYNTPLPSSLSHLIHPPTSTLYITNLRRPLLNASLHEYLFSAIEPSPMDTDESATFPPPRNPFSSTETPSLWISGVKSHAYATFPSIRSALEVAQRIEGAKWPEETGEKLHVEFVDDGEVQGLIKQEEQGWLNGRQKFQLKIIKLDDNDDGKGDESRSGGGGGNIYFKLDLVGGVTGGGMSGRGGGGGGGPGTGRAPPLPPAARAISAVPGRPIRPIPLTGTNAIGPAGAPRGPAAATATLGRGGFGSGMGIRGRALPPHQMRSSSGGGGGRMKADILASSSSNGGGGMRADGLSSSSPGRIMRRTKARPVLLWCEGPGATAAR